MARGGNEAGFAKIRTTLAVIHIVSPCGLEQCAFIANEGGRVDSTSILTAIAGAFLLAGFVKA